MGTHRTNKVFAIKEISYENLNKIKIQLKGIYRHEKVDHPNIIKLHECFLLMK